MADLRYRRGLAVLVTRGRGVRVGAAAAHPEIPPPTPSSSTVVYRVPPGEGCASPVLPAVITGLAGFLFGFALGRVSKL